MVRFLLAFVLALAAAALAGCSAEIPEGRLACSAAEPCPPDWHCHSDGLCYRLPEVGGMDAGPRDAGPRPDAAEEDAGPRPDGGDDAGMDDGGMPEVDAGCTSDGDCSDGDPCTGTEMCMAGSCRAGTAMDCADTNPCTTDTCTMGACRNEPLADGERCGAGMSYCCGGECVDTTSSELACGASCTVCGANMECLAGDCACLAGFQDCDAMVSGCESNRMTDENNCGGCGTRCPMGRSCVAGTCATCAGPGDCGDMLGCTSDMCTGGMCSNPIIAVNCVISSACYAAGARNPANSCQECDPSRSTMAWSPRTGGCDDGAAAGCGSCAGTTCTTARTCNDGLGCTVDACNDTTGACTVTPSAGSCVIAGVCYADGTVNPTNSCQECRTSSSTMAWSMRTGRCNDGNTAGCGMCSGGMCTTASTCNDAQPCTIDTCNDSTGACTFPLIPGQCLIGGTCFMGMTRNPSNQCEICDPMRANMAWSPMMDGTSCGMTTSTGCNPVTGAPVCSYMGTQMVTSHTCRSGACMTSTMGVSCMRPTDGTACEDSVFCNGRDTCSGGTCSVHAGDPCTGMTVCNEGGDYCEACGQRFQPCCYGRGCNSPSVCCGSGLGICFECCTNSDCPDASWQCISNACEYCPSSPLC